MLFTPHGVVPVGFTPSFGICLAGGRCSNARVYIEVDGAVTITAICRVERVERIGLNYALLILSVKRLKCLAIGSNGAHPLAKVVEVMYLLTFVCLQLRGVVIICRCCHNAFCGLGKCLNLCAVYERNRATTCTVVIHVAVVDVVALSALT